MLRVRGSLSLRLWSEVGRMRGKAWTSVDTWEVSVTLSLAVTPQPLQGPSLNENLSRGGNDHLITVGIRCKNVTNEPDDNLRQIA